METEHNDNVTHSLTASHLDGTGVCDNDSGANGFFVVNVSKHEH